MPQLDAATFASQLFWLGFFFIALYVILSFIAVPKIAGTFDMRKEVLEEKINEATAYRKQAETLLAEYEAALIDARIEAQERYQLRTKDISSKMGKKQKDFLAKLDHRFQLAEEDLDHMRHEMQGEVKLMAVEVAGAILEKLTGRFYPHHELVGKGEKL